MAAGELQETRQSAGSRAYLSRRYRVSASHRLHSEAYSAEENRAVYGKCNNPHGHGHNYAVEVTLGGPVDAGTGMVCDLGELDAFARRNLLERFDGMNLNTLEAFSEQVSTTENIAIAIWRRLEGKVPGARLHRVRVYERSDLFADYYGER